MININTLVSNNQIVVRSIKKDLELEQWGDENVEFGMLWTKNYIVLDPLVDGSFGSYFLIDSSTTVVQDENAQRSALIPFEITDVNEFCISTVAESIFLYENPEVNLEEEQKKGKYYPLNTDHTFKVESGSYVLHFQVCVGTPEEVDTDKEEVYYRFNFIKKDNAEFEVLIEDDYGWDLSTELLVGKK
ncbi:Competence protein J (ComJ) [Mucilaginibacter sp. OK268]|uniref:competence protein ComJ n=1 Tax=Mucilaginibacter sp. OK268 TaxID=1881048 RepID=UPI0008831C0A|nr:competence protein ComJ [Mucilaginibacter sp. OK268]SDQ00824.1 Competence protein J (ComJ) [Mucilaginibacter sp. OK268]